MHNHIYLLRHVIDRPACLLTCHFIRTHTIVPSFVCSALDADGRAAAVCMCRVVVLKSGDARFFQTTKKGEVMELKTDLNSQNKDKVKDAVKKVIASMTVGKDVSSLFTDVIKSMQTDNIELKKLVYLYIINYARSQPDKAILIVNTFQKDAMSSSPLIRALAIRTMGCIRVDRITEYLAEPLAKAIKDKDPYVRKTAAIAIAKMYDINRVRRH